MKTSSSPSSATTTPPSQPAEPRVLTPTPATRTGRAGPVPGAARRSLRVARGTDRRGQNPMWNPHGPGRKPADDGRAQGPPGSGAAADCQRRRREQDGLDAAALRRHQRPCGHHAPCCWKSTPTSTPIAQRHDAAHDGRTSYGSPEAVKLLLEAGADPLLKNQLGLTALDFAQRGNSTEAAGLIAAFVRGQAAKRSMVSPLKRNQRSVFPRLSSVRSTEMLISLHK
jgi:hypothetical protein